MSEASCIGKSPLDKVASELSDIFPRVFFVGASRFTAGDFIVGYSNGIYMSTTAI